MAVSLAIGATFAFPPPGVETGVVYDAGTRSPLAGVVVTAHVPRLHNPRYTEFDFAAYDFVTVTDSLGRYSAGFVTDVEVVFAASGYDTLRLKWRRDLVESEPCGEGLADVFLKRSRSGRGK